MLQIPKDPTAIDTQWLAHVLDAPVTAHRLVDAHAGTTGRAVLELDCAGVTQVPRRLFVKLPPADELQRAFVTSSGMGRREALFYKQLGAEVPMRVPHCYFAASDDSGEEYIMLLEHLEDSACSFQNASNHYGLAYVRAVLTEFARLHAAYWNSPRFARDLDWIEPPMQHEIAVGLVNSALDQFADSMPPVFTAMAELYLAHTDEIHCLWRQGTPTLIHGDAHDANLFMDGGRPGFLDWAVLARAPGMRDVGYFLAGTLHPEHREQLPKLLDFYREQLRENGVSPPSHEEVWRQCQWHAGYVWVGAAVTLAMGDAWQPVSYMKSSLEKLHGALDYLGSVEAIRAAL